MDWQLILDHFGFPTAFVVVVCFAMWRMCQWVKPWVEKIMAAHLSFIERVDKNVKDMRDVVNAKEDAAKFLAEAASKMAYSAEKMSECGTRMEKKVESMVCKYQP